MAGFHSALAAGCGHRKVPSVAGLSRMALDRCVQGTVREPAKAGEDFGGTAG